MVLLLGICLALSIALVWLIYKKNLQAKRANDQKIEKLSEDIGGKDRELTSKIMLINQKNHLLEKLISELELLKKSDVSSATIHNLQMELKQELSPNAWKEFELSFNEVHPGFQQRLLEKFPELIDAEGRLLYSRGYSLDAGKQELNLNRNDLPVSSGLLLLRLKRTISSFQRQAADAIAIGTKIPGNCV